MEYDIISTSDPSEDRYGLFQNTRKDLHPEQKLYAHNILQLTISLNT
jgi:hypothetical protein